MAGEYDINLSNGSVLATLYPLETNGPDNRSTPRQVKRAKPSFAVIQVPVVGAGGTFQFADDVTEYFPVGASFDIVGSLSNDGTYTVTSSSYNGTFNETSVVVGPLEVIADANISGDGILNAFVLTGDMVYRFVAGFQFDVQESGGTYGSPPVYDGNDGTYTVTAFGSWLAGSSTVIPVVEAIPGTTLPLGEIQYTVDDTRTSLVLPGKGTLNYGEKLIENIVRMTEHFAADDEPEANTNLGTNPAAQSLTGQLWYKTLAGQEGFKYYDGSSWTSNFDFDNGVLVFRDPYNDAAPGFPTYNTDIMVTADPAELVAYGYGGTPTNGDDAGLLVWTKDNPNPGDPIFRVMSSGLSERLRVEHDGYTRTSNLLEVQGAGDSHIQDRLSIGYNGTPPALSRDLDVAGQSEFNGDVYVTSASDIIFDNGQGLESVAGGLLKTGTGGKTWQVWPADNTAAAFVINDSLSNPIVQFDEVVGTHVQQYDFFVDTDTLFVDVSTDRVGINQAAPSEALDVVGNTELNGNLYVDTNVLYVDAASNEVGINKNPTYPLDVTGNTRIEGRVGINQVPPVAGTPPGTDIWLAVTGDIQANSQFLGFNGAAAEPTYSFTNDTDTGWYLSAAANMHAVTSGQLRLDITDNYISSRRTHHFITGDATAPSITHNLDNNTGIFFENPDVIGFTVNGEERLRIDVTGALRVPAGSPGYEAVVTDDDVIPNKKYVDDLVYTRSWREPVLVRDGVSTSLPAGSPLTVDGVAINVDDRVLFSALTGSPDVNDIYVWNGASWDRIVSPNDRTVGDAVYVQEGTDAGKVYAWHKDQEWKLISGAGGGAVFIYEGQVAGAAQTLFTLSNISYQPGADRLMVFVDGVKYISGVGYTENTSTTVTLAPPVPFVGGEQVEFYALADVTANANLAHEVVNLTGSPVAALVTFALTYIPGSNNLLVYLNGQKAVVGVDYTETTANSITWIGTPLVGGDQLELYSGIPVLAGTKLGDISDVDAAALTPNHGDILVFNTVSGLWEPQPHISDDGVAFDELVADGTGTQVAFNTVNVTTVAKTGTTAYQQVFVNGVLQKEGASFSYTVTGANQITFNVAPPANADVTIYQL